MEIAYSLDQINQVAQQILAQNIQKVIVVNGEMGVGKTTLIKALVFQLGVTDATNSPTFSLVNEYHGNSGQKLFHFDFYRLNNEIEAYDMGIDEYLCSGNWCFIEWAEKIASLIPKKHSTIDISIHKNGFRHLVLK